MGYPNHPPVLDTVARTSKRLLVPSINLLVWLLASIKPDSRRHLALENMNRSTSITFRFLTLSFSLRRRATVFVVPQPGIDIKDQVLFFLCIEQFKERRAVRLRTRPHEAHADRYSGRFYDPCTLLSISPCRREAWNDLRQCSSWRCSIRSHMLAETSRSPLWRLFNTEEYCLGWCQGAWCDTRGSHRPEAWGGKDARLEERACYALERSIQEHLVPHDGQKKGIPFHSFFGYDVRRCGAESDMKRINEPNQSSHSLRLGCRRRHNINLFRNRRLVICLCQHPKNTFRR